MQPATHVWPCASTPPAIRLFSFSTLTAKSPTNSPRRKSSARPPGFRRRLSGNPRAPAPGRTTHHRGHPERSEGSAFFEPTARSFAKSLRHGRARLQRAPVIHRSNVPFIRVVYDSLARVMTYHHRGIMVVGGLYGQEIIGERETIPRSKIFIGAPVRQFITIFETRRAGEAAGDSAGHQHRTPPSCGRIAQDERLLARGELPQRRANFLGRKSQAARAAGAAQHQGTAAGPLGHHAGTEFYLRAHES